MTKDMREFYKKGQQEKAAMEKVDINEENAAVEKQAEEAAENRVNTVNREGEDSQQVAAEMAQESVLGKYLNHDVLSQK